MELSRRSLLKASAAALAGSIAYELSGQSTAFAMDPLGEWKLEGTEERSTICCYCSCGCSLVCSVRGGRLIGVEGDPDHFVSEGGLCPKGAAEFQTDYIVDPETHELVENEARITTPLVRRPGSDHWEQISWDRAVDEIARHIKDTRDETFETTNDQGVTVNRTQAIGFLGGSGMTCEEQHVINKFARMVGSITLDNQARV